VVRSVVARAVAVRVVVNKAVRGGLVGGIGRWGLVKGGVFGGFVAVEEEEEEEKMAEGENMVAMEMERCGCSFFFLSAISIEAWKIFLIQYSGRELVLGSKRLRLLLFQLHIRTKKPQQAKKILADKKGNRHSKDFIIAHPSKEENQKLHDLKKMKGKQNSI
jgi:hypothetical protein